MGKLGAALLGLGVGGYLVSKAILGLRRGTIEANYVSMQYTRSESAFMFWSVVVFSGAFGAFMLVGGLGVLIGLW